MNTRSKAQVLSEDAAPSLSAEQRLKGLGIKLPKPPEAFGTYVEAVEIAALVRKFIGS
jgi:hypothetical protein